MGAKGVVADPAKVALAQALYDAWNAAMPIDELVERFFSEDVEWHEQPELPGSGLHRGRQEVAAMLKALEATLGHFEVDLERIEDLGDHLAIAVFMLRGAGQTSGISVASRTVHLLSIADAKIHRVRAFLTLEPIVDPRRGGRAPGGVVPGSESTERKKAHPRTRTRRTGEWPRS